MAMDSFIARISLAREPESEQALLVQGQSGWRQPEGVVAAI
jgi:hypothetical protein